MEGSARIGRWLRWWMLGYFVLLTAVVCAMIWTKLAVVSQSSQTSISDWQTWREDERERQLHPGPVERRVPKSDEPPALVLMRDYFAVLMVGAVLFSSLLFWITAWFITGMMITRPSAQ